MPGLESGDRLQLATETLTAISKSMVSDDVRKQAETWLAFLKSLEQRLLVAAKKNPERFNILLQEIIVDEFWPRLLELTQWSNKKAAQLVRREATKDDVTASDSMLQNSHRVLFDCFDYLRESNSQHEIVPIKKAAQFYEGIESLRGELFSPESFKLKWSNDVINERFEKLIPFLPVFADTEKARTSIQTNGPRLFRWVRGLVNKEANPGDYLNGAQLFDTVTNFSRLAKEVFKDRGWFGGKNLWKELTPEQVFELFAKQDPHISRAIQGLAITNSDFRAKLRAGLKELVDAANSRVLTPTELASLKYATRYGKAERAQETMRLLIVGDGIGDKWRYQQQWLDAIKIIPAVAEKTATATAATAAMRIQAVWRGYQGRKEANWRDDQGRKAAEEAKEAGVELLCRAARAGRYKVPEEKRDKLRVGKMDRVDQAGEILL